MGKRNKAGFTLVEILIVVVILGILAAIVAPQFTSASQEAIKGALQSQLQTINSQVELYRVRNQGDMPWGSDLSGIAGADAASWGPLVADEYLKEAPVNGFTGESTLVADTGAIAAGTDSANGWAADTDSTVYAVGYDSVNNLLFGETGTDDEGNEVAWANPAGEDDDGGGGGN